VLIEDNAIEETELEPEEDEVVEGGKGAVPEGVKRGEEKREKEEEEEDNIFSPKREEEAPQTGESSLSQETSPEKVIILDLEGENPFSPETYINHQTIEVDNSPAVLSSTAPSQSDRFQLLHKLFGFLASSTAQQGLNPVLAGYFTKLLQILYDNQTKLLVQFLYRNGELLKQMVAHVETQGVADLL
jgi:hypothetical protein